MLSGFYSSGRPRRKVELDFPALQMINDVNVNVRQVGKAVCVNGTLEDVFPPRQGEWLLPRQIALNNKPERAGDRSCI
jgi:hypothetical protein